MPSIPCISLRFKRGKTMIKTKAFPRIMICAPGSGSGKTLITCGLLRILERQGYMPGAFKCGPDYIDPMFHKKVLGIPSRNLDLFLMGNMGVKEALSRGAKGRSFGVLEGVMGLFDGQSADSSEGSSYDIAGATGTPVILVVNCKGMSRSVIPVVKGFCDYDREKLIQGVILNNISLMVSEGIKKGIEEETGIPVIAALPKLPEVNLESRHLGLVMPDEVQGLLDMIDKVADSLLDSLDLEKLAEIAQNAKKIMLLEEFDVPEESKTNTEKIRVGIARDEAFCFYYEDNLDLLRQLGAEPVFFSPIHDKKLPQVSRLIIGGGYPELHAKELSENVSMKEDIYRAAKAGMPILAECGGFLYLQESLTDPEGQSYEMVGAISGHGHMTDRLGHFGYVTVTSTQKSPYLKASEAIKAHEFHYYDTDDNGEICRLTKLSGRSWMGYRAEKNVFAGFAHLYYPSRPEFIMRFLEC